MNTPAPKSAPESTSESAPAWRPWLVCSIGALSFCYAFFQRVAPSVMVTDLMRDFQASGAILGNLSAFYFYAYAGLQLPVGILVDRYGPRRVLTGGAVLACIGSLLFASADSLTQAYAGRLLIGAGSGCGFVSALTLAARWFPPRRFALVSGLIIMGGMSGGIFGQAPLAWAVAAMGWRGTMFAAAAVAVVLAVAIWLLVRDWPEPQGEARAGSTATGAGILAGVGRAVGMPQTWILAGAAAGLTAPLLAFGGLWGVPYMMVKHGLDRPVAAGAVSLILIGWAIGAPALGWLSDRLGRRKLPLIGATIVAAVSLAVLIFTPGLPLAAVNALMVVHGAAAAGMVICFAAIRELAPTAIAGTAVAFVNMSVTGMGAIFQPLLGWLLDLGWQGGMDGGARVYSVANFEQTFLVLSGVGTVSILIALLARETWCKPVGSTAEGR